MKGPVLLILGCLATTSVLRAEPAATRALVEADWEQQELVSRKRSCEDVGALEGVLDRGRLMISDMRKLGAVAKAEQTETVLEEIERKASAGGQGRATRELYMRARWTLRDLALSNPEIDFDEIVFVKRQWPRYNHQCSHRVGEAQIPGANLCVLKGLSPDGEIRELLPEGYSRGGIGRFDLSYDAKRVIFPYAKPRFQPTPYGSGKPGVRGGACIMYDVYEVGLDGANLRQLTDDPTAEDTEPIYLPDGRIAFMTSRDDRFVQCGDWALACGLYTMNNDGADLRRVTEPKEGEFYPNMLADGRIMYTRWDYVMKGYNVIQQLWAVNPDGRNASLVFGDHYAFSIGPIAFFEARQIPGSSKVICIGAAHHNTGVGPVMILDLKQNRGRRSSMVNVTPEVGYPEINSKVFDEIVYEELPGKGISNRSNDTGWYSSPYPITDKHFLVVCSYEKDNASPRGYGLYLVDIHHNRELIYRFEDASCYSPMPVRPRKKPAVIPDFVSGVDPNTAGTLLVTDVYQGLEGVPRGEAKFLRILETHSKTVHTKPQRCDVGVNSGWDVRGVLGTAPIEEDGSIYFQVPPGKQLFFEVLDKDYLEIRRMRNFMNVMPGEVNSCVGCHEPYGVAPRTGAKSMVMSGKLPSVITPPPWGTGGFSFNKIVQPILNQHCVSCHDGADGEKKSFDLRGARMRSAPVGYDRDHAPHAQHQVSDSFLSLLEYISYIRVGGYQGEKLPLPPNATGSRQSKLMKLLKHGHYEVELSMAEWRAFAAWIDCNAPYYGSWDEIQLPAPNTLPLKNKRRIDERVRQLGGDVLAYLDCGVQSRSGDGAVFIKLVQGRPWFYKGSETVDVAAGHRDIVFDANQIVFELKGIEPGGRYVANMSWWDFDTDLRRQSVWVSKPGDSDRMQVRKSAGMPAYRVRKELPGTVSVALPQQSVKNGSTHLVIQCEGGANAVVGEIWLREEAP